jgi:hypothetical protein
MIGIFTLGIEPVGILDRIVAVLQGAITADSSYILFTRTYIELRNDSWLIIQYSTIRY